MIRAARRAALVLVIATLVISTTARADDLQDAEAAYDAATEAHQQKDYAAAARLFARADELAPNAVALETALREAILADLPDLARELVARSRRETAPTPGLLEAVKIAEEKYPSPAQPIEVAAPPPVEIAPPPPIVRDVEPTVEGIHPAWITIGLVGTAAFGAASIATYVDALAIENDLEALRASGERDGAAELAERGEDAEVRLYVFEGLTGASAIATVLVAALAIDWNGQASGRATLAPNVAIGPSRVQLAWAF